MTIETPRLLTGIATLCLVALGLCSSADAQFPQSSLYGRERGIGANRATLSPYLNLLNQQTGLDGSQQFGTVYYGLVRPQIDQRRAQRDQQRALSQIKEEVREVQSQLSGGGVRSGVPRTGHSSRFMSFSHYYPNLQPPR